MIDDTIVIEVFGRGPDSIILEVSHDCDLDEPFIGECWETGDMIRVSNPWACDIITL